MRELNGSELAGFIKERQAKQVRALRQARKIFPKLAIVVTVDDPVINTYMRLKQNYGADILIEVEIHKITLEQAASAIKQLNEDAQVHGIIVQLPLSDPDQTETVLNLVSPKKDVDGLGDKAIWDPATPTAINWLLTGYNIELRGKRIAIIGQGRLVGAPLAKMWRASGYDVHTYDKDSDNLLTELEQTEIIVSATGSPGLLRSQNVALGAVVVDAGTASEDGKLKGDVNDDLRDRNDLTITPKIGGVGPLTVCALFDNVIRAASQEKA